jgi:hypothetical protein
MTTRHWTLSHTKGVDYPVGCEESMSLQDIADLVKRTTAEHKEALPMIIGGTFDGTTGATRERKNDNMLSVTWIMGDYDSGEMAPLEAAQKLRDAKITGLVYTSPRHELEGMKGTGQRWRVMCPLAEPVTLLEHAALARRLNGTFGQDVLGTEGKSASRPYYIGSLTNRPECLTFLSEGDDYRHLDQATDIPKLPFPRSSAERIAMPILAGDADAEVVGRVILQTAATFEDGHEGLRPACMLIAPYVRLGAIDPDEVAEALQAQLAATSSRRPEDVPDGEAMRTLKWAMYSNNVSENVEPLELALQLDEIDITTAVRRLAVRYTDATDDFLFAEPLPPDEGEDRIVAEHVRKAGLNELEFEAFDLPADDMAIPPREWVYGDHYLRKYVSVTVAAGGTGKSAHALVEALDMVTRRGILGEVQDPSALRVGYWNGEDDIIEIRRRLTAACRHHKIKKSEISGKLFIMSGRQCPIVLTKSEGREFEINPAAIKRLRDAVRKHRLDVLILDPFVSIHRVPENENGAIDMVVKALAMEIAEPENIAVEAVHHTRKGSAGGGTEKSVDDARGAKSLTDAGRSTRVMNRMDPETAGRAGISDTARRQYVRLDRGDKTNFTAGDSGVWRHITSYVLENAQDGRKADSVGVVEPWTMPTASAAVAEHISAERVKTLHASLEAGGPAARNWQSGDRWVGCTIADMLGWDATADRSRLNGMLKELIRGGTLTEVKHRDKRSGRDSVLVAPVSTRNDPDAWKTDHADD